MEKRKENLYLVSDSTGVTVTTLAKSVIEQFTNIEFEKYFWPLVREVEQVKEIVKEVEKKPGIVLYTILEAEIREKLKKECERLGVLCISPIGRIVNDMEEYLGTVTNLKTSVKTFKDSKDYFSKIEAINYTIMHDDGQMIDSINKADIIIIGVSRTSKTPTSFVLGNRGLKTANIPFVPSLKFPIDIESYKDNLIIALNIDSEILLKIRQNRLREFYGEYVPQGEYANISAIEKELEIAKNFYTQHNILVIDITGKAVEEVATEIFNIYLEKRGSHKIEEL